MKTLRMLRCTVVTLAACATTADAMAENAKEGIYVYKGTETKYSAAYNLADVPKLTIDGDKVVFSVGGVEKKTLSAANGLTIKFGKKFLKGDVDDDGTVTMADANATTNKYLGDTKAINEVAADMDDDGQISMSDSNGIVNTYLGEE